MTSELEIRCILAKPVERLTVKRSHSLLKFLIALGLCAVTADKPNDEQECIEEQIPVASLEEISHLKIKNNEIAIRSYQVGGSDIVYFNMHDNEKTGVEAAQRIIDGYGGCLLELKHRGRRLIRFNSEGRVLYFDPNRIFTDKGIRSTLDRNGRYSSSASEATRDFAASLLDKILSKNPRLIVALHNNLKGEFPIDNYLGKRRYASCASDVFVSKDKDPNDFFFVTEPNIFNCLKDRGYNVVLQANKTVIDDGSLSVYCGRAGIPYVNAETQMDHLEEQTKMLEEIPEMLKEIQGIMPGMVTQETTGKKVSCLAYNLPNYAFKL